MARASKDTTGVDAQGITRRIRAGDQVPDWLSDVPPDDVEDASAGDRDPEQMTVAQLRAELDAAGVEHAPGHGKKALVEAVRQVRG